MKWARTLPVGIAFVATTFFVAASTVPKLYPLKIRTTQAEVPFRVELAQTYAEREKGLMGRTYLAKNRGMLFVFEKEGSVRFWMKDTLIPLDMLFIGKDHRIKTITKVVPPCPPKAECPTYGPSEPVKYVLELRAGISDEKQIEVGDTVVTSF